MYREELSDIEKIEGYRGCLDTEPPSMEKSARILLVDELLQRIDDGLNEPIEAAYCLFMKYAEWYEISKEEIFSDMADEALFIVDLCNSEFTVY